MKKSFLLFFLLMLPFALFANDKEVVMHNPSGSHYELVDLDPPVVTYDDELNELTVYFVAQAQSTWSVMTELAHHIISYMVNTIRVTPQQPIITSRQVTTLSPSTVCMA